MNLHQIFNTILTNRKEIIRVTAAGTVILFLIFFFIYPVSYKAEVTILPPEKNKELGGLGTLLAGQDFSSLLTGGTSSVNSQLFVEMLKSRTAAEYVVRKLGLQKYYDTKSVQEAVEKLQKDLEIELTKEGIIKLNVEVSSSALPLIFDKQDTLKNFAANVSNSYVEALDIINREKLSSKAKKAREYIQEQLVATRIQLDSVETALMDFQKMNKTISLPEQVQAAIDAAANIKTEIVKTEIEIGMMGSNLRDDNKNLIALREKLNELQQQYGKMEMGNKDYLLAFSQVPSLGKSLATLLRDVKIQNEVYLLLQQQYYKEKIQEKRDLPIVDVLDSAVPPRKASGPRVIFASAMGGIFIFLLITLVNVFKEKKILIYRRKDG